MGKNKVERDIDRWRGFLLLCMNGGASWVEEMIGVKGERERICHHRHLLDCVQVVD